MGVKITDMTEAPSADGSELIPTSKAGAPRSLTTAKVKDYVVSAIEALDSVESIDGEDAVYVLKDGALAPVDVGVVAQHVVDAVWGKDGEDTPAGTDKVPLQKADSTEKVLALSDLAAYVRDAIRAAILNLSTLDDGASGLASTDYMLVTQGTTAKRVKVSDIYAAIYAGLATHVAGVTAAGSTDADDVLYLVRGTTPYAVKLSQIAAFVSAGASVGGSGTSGFLAQWSGASTLTAGPSIVDSEAGLSGSDLVVPTAKAVKDYVDANAGGDPESVMAEVTDVSAYGWVVDEDDMASDSATKVPTQQSVKAYVDANAGGDPSAAIAEALLPCVVMHGEQLLAFNATGTLASTEERVLWEQGVAAYGASAVRFRAFGVTGENANSKTIRFKAGDTTIHEISTTTPGDSWSLDVCLMLNGFSKHVVSVNSVIGGVPDTTCVKLEEDQEELEVSITGENGTASKDDIALHGVTVEKLPIWGSIGV